MLYLAGTFLLAFAFVGANAAAKQCGTTFLQSNLLEAFLENAFTEFPDVASTHEDHDITRLEFRLQNRQQVQLVAHETGIAMSAVRCAVCHQRTGHAFNGLFAGRINISYQEHITVGKRTAKGIVLVAGTRKQVRLESHDNAAVRERIAETEQCRRGFGRMVRIVIKD